MVNIERLCTEIGAIQNRCYQQTQKLQHCTSQISSSAYYTSAFEGDGASVASLLQNAENAVNNAARSMEQLQAALGEYTKVIRN